MNSAPHRIRSLRWQVGADSTAEAFHWRALLREKGTELLLPVLEQGFDEITPGEQVIHIPRIELSIRLDSGEELETILPGEILHQFREQLQRMLTGDATAGQSPVREEITTGRNRFDILLRYLQTGILSWQVANVTASDQAVVLSKVCRDEWPRIVEHLQVVQEDAPFYFRLLQLHSEEECNLIIQALSGDIPQESKTAAMEYLELLQDEGSERFSRYTRLNLIADILAKNNGWLEASELHSLLKLANATAPHREMQEGFIADQPSIESARFRPLAETLSPATTPQHSETDLSFPATPLRNQVTAMFRQEDADTITGRVGTAPGAEILEPTDSSHPRLHAENTIVARRRHPDAFPDAGEKPDALPEMCRQSRFEPSAEPTPILFPMLIQQAGLVLLHPYITRFFENCGVKETGVAELRTSNLPRAAALLHFLATGREELYEYELGLIKTVLGLHPEAPLLVCAGLLTPDDIEEAEALLQSVISHWSVLKNTSIHGLRSSFIERPGLLRKEENSWRLNVERKPYDILLDQIPWSIGIIKLPWMQQAIFTEW
ncbi:MAG: contractile injection system tape measure protein [Pedobacter sp.]